jgi:preprotein translocase SecE subunit
LRAIAQEQRAGSGKAGLGSRVKDFFRDSWLELQKVIWPSQEDVVKMTGLVVAVVFVVSAFMSLWGWILMQMTAPLFE